MLRCTRCRWPSHKWRPLTQGIQNVQCAGIACTIGDKASVSESCLVVVESRHAVFQDESFSLLQRNGLCVNLTAFGGRVST
ncbi:hypothetical protein I79_001583 [Cricetulus griseus]|uniref:Uncharacterized protein n=1 Tax=Cricetulus griseus TaxID=10029 RepID=G3GV52_CRIGR|nr:hypothetical protein I79_001583 [Cricetulus griseus]